MTATVTTTPTRTRAERYAKMAPAGATVTITDDNTRYLNITQVTIRGTIDTILVTIGAAPGKTRTRVSACEWFNSGSKTRTIKVMHLVWRIRGLYVS